MNLTGFLYGSKARLFMKELWTHLTSAQDNTSGIPTEFLEEKKEEIREMKVIMERCIRWKKWRLVIYTYIVIVL